MIVSSNRVQIMVATKPADFRQQLDGLVAYVKSALRKDPFTGTGFLFRAKRTDGTSQRSRYTRVPQAARPDFS